MDESIHQLLAETPVTEPSAQPGPLSVRGLTKTYGTRRVVDDVRFDCPAGTVTGFLGPNGSGKSTTLRMVIGHSSRTAGVATFGGLEFRDLANPGREVGVLLDASAQHPGRTVWETARLASLILGVDSRRTRSCLEAVGLRSVQRKRVGALSLGMRQRLGLAIAVLGSPQFLLLDEPANGLDPEGIEWLRNFLRHFASQGGTVLVSSHQLAEIEAMADQVFVIDRGIVRSLDVLRLEDEPQVCLVSSEDDEALRDYLVAQGLTIMSSPNCSPIHVQGLPSDIGRHALAAGIALSGLSRATKPSLEERFLASTSGEHAGLSGDDLLDLVRR